MSEYDRFAECYDVLMGNRAECVAQVKQLLRVHAPKARTILELGCGTGTILRQLGKRYRLTGLDLSADMLRRARRKVPAATFHRQNIARLQLSERFDVILCLFDTINHLTSFSEWQHVFRRVHKTLNPQGVFIFDVNTVHGMRVYAERTPFAEFYPGGIGIFDATPTSRNRYRLDLRLLRQTAGKTYRLHQTQIEELVVPTERVIAALKGQFGEVKLWDADRRRPNAKSEELYFICRN
jgi:trans-aconitate methyltransferase